MSSSIEFYNQIFAGAESPADLRRAIARAVRELRAAMEKEENSAVTLAHVRSLMDLKPADLARAYATAERTSVFWPSPGQIRELAGWPETRDAYEALEWILGYLEAHRPEGRPSGGGVIFRDDGTGRREDVAGAPAAPAPEIPPKIALTLTTIGGSIRGGLHAIAQHPRLKGWEAGSSEPTSKTAERVERQWVRCYQQISRDKIPSSLDSRRISG